MRPDGISCPITGRNEYFGNAEDAAEEKTPEQNWYPAEAVHGHPEEPNRWNPEKAVEKQR